MGNVQNIIQVYFNIPSSETFVVVLRNLWFSLSSDKGICEIRLGAYCASVALLLFLYMLIPTDHTTVALNEVACGHFFHHELSLWMWGCISLKDHICTVFSFHFNWFMSIQSCQCICSTLHSFCSQLLMLGSGQQFIHDGTP